MDANKYQELANQLQHFTDKLKFIDKLITDFKDISADLNVIRDHFAKQANKLKLDYFDRVTEDLHQALQLNEQLRKTVITGSAEMEDKRKPKVDDTFVDSEGKTAFINTKQPTPIDLIATEEKLLKPEKKKRGRPKKVKK